MDYIHNRRLESDLFKKIRKRFTEKHLFCSPKRLLVCQTCEPNRGKIACGIEICTQQDPLQHFNH